MKYLSVCSGIEAATVAWEPLGWTPLAFSEIEPFPSAVLAHHWPHVPNLGDFTAIQRADFETGGRAAAPAAAWAFNGDQSEATRSMGESFEVVPTLRADGPVHVSYSTATTYPDLIIGGTPCQAFSVAGLRNSLEDERGNLTLEFVRLCDRLSPDYIVWENVPGVLGGLADNPFGCFLGAIVGAGEPLTPPGGRWTDAGLVSGPERRAAWRVLDAQYFGVAQRRRRVFVVACPTDGADPAAILLECEGVRRDSPPSREPREGVAGGATRGFASGSLGGYAESHGGGVSEVTGATSAGEAKPCWPAEVAATLRRENGAPGYADQDLFSQQGANLVPTCIAHGQANAEIVRDGSPSLTCNHDGPPIVMAPSFSKRPGQQIATRQDDTSFALTGGGTSECTRGWL